MKEIRQQFFLGSFVQLRIAKVKKEAKVSTLQHLSGWLPVHRYHHQREFPLFGIQRKLKDLLMHSTRYSF